MQAQPPYRYNSYHGQKRQLLGSHAGNAAPAWKVNQQARKASGSQELLGSKILLSRLPTDVGEDEVQALFVKTVGPVKESFIVHNSQGNSKGMAVVSFHRVEDAAVARTKYNGKIIDGRRPIKIEIIKDDDVAPKAPPKPTAPPSLLQRLGGKLPPTAPSGVKAPPIIIPPKKQPLPPRAAPAAPRAQTGSVRRPLRQKKGPKRVKKIVKQPMTASQLDAEMEEYRAHGDE
ncbi:hypothetical protein PHLCEN_2v10214 [Hermanssonia centrifuga]|uniref:RRM domain-containing protein n=1 Tax=Hermanssonia centrifuga TaxID=98765 RepID=A0A2R6NNI8_9APHY|nr:hypothetical protein PHLCEN_2v10214 [Hermanssonia centrifuga]